MVHDEVLYLQHAYVPVTGLSPTNTCVIDYEGLSQTAASSASWALNRIAVRTTLTNVAKLARASPPPTRLNAMPRARRPNTRTRSRPPSSSHAKLSSGNLATNVSHGDETSAAATPVATPGFC